MFITTKYFLITVICSESVIGRLKENLAKFKLVNYTVEKVNAPIAGTISGDGCRMQSLCSKDVNFDVMNYLKEYYSKDFGIVYYAQEADMPM